MNKTKKIFIACDTTKIQKVKNIINNSKTNKLKIGYKFGLEFLNSKNGRSFIAKTKKKITFVDLKLNDIPNTCASTIKAVKDLKINYLTIHISSGLEALKISKKVAGKIRLVGVTTLTSLDEKNIKLIGYDKKLSELVKHQARLANKAGLDALVCSPLEVKLIRKIFKKEIITPGIRFNFGKNDQKRVSSPKEAFRNGSDWLVIGRPITKGNIKKNIQKLINSLK